MKIILFIMLFSVSLFASDVYYGGKTLTDLKQFGIEVRVFCNEPLKKHETEFREIIVTRLEKRGFKIHTSSNVILKLFVTAIQSNVHSYIVHFSLQIHQGAYLGFNNKQVDAPTWDAWKMGEYKELEVFKEVDELVRLFVNDYLQSN